MDDKITATASPAGDEDRFDEEKHSEGDVDQSNKVNMDMGPEILNLWSSLNFKRDSAMFCTSNGEFLLINIFLKRQISQIGW